MEREFQIGVVELNGEEWHNSAHSGVYRMADIEKLGLISALIP